MDHLQSLKQGLSEKDLEIANRLEKLMADVDHKPAIPFEEEIRKRLDILQDRQPSTSTEPPKVFYQIPSTKTETEQVDQLMKQYMEEMSIKGENNADDSDDEEMAVTNVIERATAEAALPTVEKGSGQLTPPDWEPDDAAPIGVEELPWCEICNNDASIRCLECDGALYCSRCLRETHDSFDLKHHKTVPYRK